MGRRVVEGKVVDHSGRERCIEHCFGGFRFFHPQNNHLGEVRFLEYCCCAVALLVQQRRELPGSFRAERRCPLCIFSLHERTPFFPQFHHEERFPHQHHYSEQSASFMVWFSWESFLARSFLQLWFRTSSSHIGPVCKLSGRTRAQSPCTIYILSVSSAVYLYTSGLWRDPVCGTLETYSVYVYFQTV